MSTPLETFPTTITAQPSPVSGWRRLLGDWVVVSGTTAVCQALGAASSLLLRMALDPAQMGVWQALKLFLTNGNYANLGISKGAAREFTIALGRGNLSAVKHSLNLAFTVNTLTSVLYAAILAVVGIWIGCTSGGAWANAWAVGLVVVGGLAVLQRYVTFQVTLLRAKLDFTNTSQLAILEGVLTLAVCTPATWLWGLPGLYGGTLAVLLASLGYLHCHGAMPLTWAWEMAEIRRLIGIGSPILLAGVVSTLFRSLDKLMILGYLSDREFQLGCYSLALLVTGQLYGLGNMLSIVIAPRLGEKYGHSGSRREVAHLAARSSELQAAAIALPAALAMVAAGPLLGRLLPDYRTGLVPMLWLVPGVIALVLALLPSQYLIAVDRQQWSLAAVAIGAGVAAVGNHVALRSGYGLPGIAAATSASYLAYFFLVAVPVWMQLDGTGRLRCVAMHALAIGPSLALAVLLEYLRPTAQCDAMVVLAKAGAVTVAWGLTIAAGWHFGAWRDAMQPTTA